MRPHTALLGLPDAIEAFGGTVWALDEWEYRQQGYFWTTEDEEQGYDVPPNGAMWHHTVSTGYTPSVVRPDGRTVYNAVIGWRRGDRLYQDPRPGDVATVALQAAGPANYSAGAGVRRVLDDFVSQGLPFEGRQTDRDDRPLFFGNRYYWSPAVVVDGTGHAVDDEIWELIGIVANAFNTLLRLPRNGAAHITHGQHTTRKIDYRDGRYSNHWDTVSAIRAMLQSGSEEESMKLGDISINVAKWKNYLNRCMETYNVNWGAPLEETNLFDAATVTRTKQFQRWANIADSGEVGYFDAATMAVAIGPDTGE